MQRTFGSLALIAFLALGGCKSTDNSTAMDASITDSGHIDADNGHHNPINSDGGAMCAPVGASCETQQCCAGLMCYTNPLGFTHCDGLIDGSVVRDSGAPDAGTSADAGTTDDAGTSSDAGTTSDSSTDDAGPV